MDPSTLPIDWHGEVLLAGREGRLLQLLHTLPRERWTASDPDGRTLFHCAARGDNVAAAVALLQSGVDVNVRNKNFNAAHMAAIDKQPRVLEMLCAAGVDMTARIQGGRTALDLSLCTRSLACSRVMLANGMRLSTVQERYRRYNTRAGGF